jgi:type I restriction enzyme S subunit
VSLGDLIASGPQNGLYKPAADYGSGTLIVRIDAYQSGETIRLSDLKRVRLTQAERVLYALAPGDFLINRVNSRSHLGKSTVVPRLPEVAVFESNMMRFRLRESSIDSYYALHALQTPYLKAQVQKQAKDASNQSSINQDDVLGLRLLLPPLPLQHRFAEVVRAHERLRATQRESLRQADHLFQSLLHRFFTTES